MPSLLGQFISIGDVVAYGRQGYAAGTLGVGVVTGIVDNHFVNVVIPVESYIRTLTVEGKPVGRGSELNLSGLISKGVLSMENRYSNRLTYHRTHKMRQDKLVVIPNADIKKVLKLD